MCSYGSAARLCAAPASNCELNLHNFYCSGYKYQVFYYSRFSGKYPRLGLLSQFVKSRFSPSISVIVMI